MAPALVQPTLILAMRSALESAPPRDPAGERAVRAALFARLPSLGCIPGPGAHLAHSGGCVAYLAGAPGTTGVDLEWLRPRDVVSLARFAFSAEEARRVVATEATRRVQAFHELWVLKEAAAKALGLDLFTALAQARFSVDGGSISGELPGCSSWTAELYAPRPALRLAVLHAADAPAPASQVEWRVEADDWKPVRWDRIATSLASR